MSELQIDDLVTLSDDATPRIHDLRLANVLGFERPRDIRKIIERNLQEIETYGGCATVAQTPGPLGGRPTREFWLSEEQALLVTMFSRTARAAEARREIIRVFLAYRHALADKPVVVAAHRRARPTPKSKAPLDVADWRYRMIERGDNGLCELHLVVPTHIQFVISILFNTLMERERETAGAYR